MLLKDSELFLLPKPEELNVHLLVKEFFDKHWLGNSLMAEKLEEEEN